VPRRGADVVERDGHVSLGGNEIVLKSVFDARGSRRRKRC
jgi:hypothetical protein